MSGSLTSLAAWGALLQSYAPLSDAPAPETYVPDARIQTLDYRPGQVMRLETAPGYQVTVLLAPDERVESIAVGDAAHWQVAASRAGNQLFVKLVQPAGPTNMTVLTDVRSYAFDLLPLAGPTAYMPYTLHLRYADTADAALPPAEKPDIGVYTLRGDAALHPVYISDDGEKTFIGWHDDSELPAVFIIDASGREALANGAMRGEFYVIDAVAGELVFRLDALRARALRRLK